MNKRNVNIEFLRILSMLLIVYHHFNVHSGWDFPSTFSKRAYMIQTIGSFGKIGVIIFILITGYFMNKGSFHLKKLFYLSNNIRFYTIFALGIGFLFNGRIDLSSGIRSLFPIIFQQYWFVTSYVILIALQPILQSFFIHKNRNEKIKYFFMLVIIFYIPEYFGIASNVTEYFVPGNLLSFLMIAFAGHLVNEYNDELKNKYFKYVVAIFTITLALIFLRPIILLDFSDVFAFTANFLIGLGSLNALLFSISLFIIIQKVKLPLHYLILSISPLVFDVYLIHDNRIIRPILWQHIFKNKEFMNSQFLPLINIFEPLLIFVVCLLLAKVRVILFNQITRRRKVKNI